MKTRTRDDAISKNQYALRVMTITCLAQSVAIIVLGALVLFGFFSREVMYVPTMGGTSYTQSQMRLSPTYLEHVATDVMQLRLTFSADTIVARYEQLLSMVKPSALRAVRSAFNAEIKAVKKRNMQSVFYQDKALVDIKENQVKVSGFLQRVDDGVLLPKAHKTYLIQFNNVFGTVKIVSIKEVTAHA